MGIEQNTGTLELSYLAELDAEVDRLAQAMEGLRADGTASDEEADAFADCIEDLWVRIITVRRDHLRGGMDARRHGESVRMVRSVIRMLEGDLAFARERGRP